MRGGVSGSGGGRRCR
uniref:Uncharacterized protein n=1 Tax=Arundo donax TaxID=35708 RepID=A0A0A9T6P0_ARUDO